MSPELKLEDLDENTFFRTSSGTLGRLLKKGAMGARVILYRPCNRKLPSGTVLRILPSRTVIAMSTAVVIEPNPPVRTEKMTDTPKAPRVTAASTIRAGIEAGNEDAVIVAAVKEAFPTKRNVAGLVKYYRKHPLKRAAKAAEAEVSA